MAGEELGGKSCPSIAGSPTFLWNVWFWLKTIWNDSNVYFLEYQSEKVAQRASTKIFWDLEALGAQLYPNLSPFSPHQLGVGDNQKMLRRHPQLETHHLPILSIYLRYIPGISPLNHLKQIWNILNHHSQEYPESHQLLSPFNHIQSPWNGIRIC